jgi:SAM-dependent methyltransferase
MWQNGRRVAGDGAPEYHRRVPRRNALFTALYHCGRAFERAATLWFHAAAGALRLGDLRATIEREWDDAGGSESDNYIASGLMGWERDFYLRFLKPDDRVLVIGCGTGRDLLALLQLGYRAEGLDVAPRCTATAGRLLQERGFHTPIYTGAIETFDLPGHFDAFIFSWFCYSYIPQSENRIRLLRKLRDHLNPGGRILVSYNPGTMAPRRLPIRLTQLVAWLCRSDWRPEYGDHLSIQGSHILHYEHQFTLEKFEEEARTAGLTVAFHERNDQGTAALVA